MTKTIKNKKSASKTRFIILDADNSWLSALGKSRSTMCDDEDDIINVLPKTNKDSLWISSNADSTDTLLRAIRNAFFHGNLKPSRSIGRLLMLESPGNKALPFLHHWFQTLIGGSSSFKTLPQEQLLEVLSASKEERQDLFIGGVMDQKIGLISLIRGNLDRVTVPLSIFRRSGTTRPNFKSFELDDYGHTVRFGDYEASADFILYEAAPDYRQRIKAKRQKDEKGFGASLRRLRILRGLSRDDFAGVSAKTIARIERGEVEKPQGRTMSMIAKAVGVEPGEIESY